MKFLNTFVALIFISSVSTASAGIINADYLEAGDNLAVYDSNTGVTWLDLTVSAGFSIAAGEAEFTGYSVATDEQLTELWTNNFYDNLTDQDLWYSLFGSSEPDITRCAWEIACSYGMTASTLSAGYGVNDGRTGIYGRLYTRPYIRGTYAFLFTKDVVVNTSAIPEPSTLAIFAFGLCGLAARRFNKVA